MGAVSFTAGIIVSAFTLVYIGIALWLYCSRKRGILAGLIAFAEAYDQSKQDILKEMLVPYAVTDRTGRLLWMNREFSLILGEDKTAAPNLTALFPEVTKEMLATGGETSEHTQLIFGEKLPGRPAGSWRLLPCLRPCLIMVWKREKAALRLSISWMRPRR